MRHPPGLKGFLLALALLLGLILGLILNNKGLKLRNFYRTLLIVSWALPGVITVQVWVALPSCAT
jgi:arabinogalactan oligomer/maltooligosaccharide transport system permease protein